MSLRGTAGQCPPAVLAAVRDPSRWARRFSGRQTDATAQRARHGPRRWRGPVRGRMRLTGCPPRARQAHGLAALSARWGRAQDRAEQASCGSVRRGPLPGWSRRGRAGSEAATTRALFSWLSAAPSSRRPCPSSDDQDRDARRAGGVAACSSTVHDGVPYPPPRRRHRAEAASTPSQLASRPTTTDCTSTATSTWPPLRRERPPRHPPRSELQARSTAYGRRLTWG
jgi:hypothetical protein